MATPPNATSAIISLLMDEVRQSLEPKISTILTDYQMYKETHEAMLQIPFVQYLLKHQHQCKCQQTEIDPVQEPVQPIQLEIIDVEPDCVDGLHNLDSITEYINASMDDEEAAAPTKQPTKQEEEEEEEEEEEQPNKEEEEEVQPTKEEEEEVQPKEEEQPTKEEEPKEEEQPTKGEEPKEEQPTKEEQEEETKEEEDESEEEELELFEVIVKGKPYVTNDEMDGDIYEYANDEVGAIVGSFKNGVAKFIKKKK